MPSDFNLEFRFGFFQNPKFGAHFKSGLLTIVIQIFIAKKLIQIPAHSENSISNSSMDPGHYIGNIINLYDLIRRARRVRFMRCLRARRDLRILSEY